MGIATAVLWVIIGLTYVVHKCVSEKIGSILYPIFLILLIASSLFTSSQVYQLTDSSICGISVLILSSTLIPYMAQGDVRFAIMFAVACLCSFSPLLAIVGIVVFLQDQNGWTLVASILLTVIAICSYCKDKKG